MIARGHHARRLELRPDQLCGSIARFVVDHDDVGADVAEVVEDGAEARPQPFRLVRRNSDDCNVVHSAH
jgi:hypothetical protein